MNDPRDWIGWGAIAAGGGAGAFIRWALARLAIRASSDRASRFDPAAWATLAANLLACFLLGGLLSLPSPSASTPEGLRAAFPAFAATGFCGSLSTFSTLCADAVRQVRAAPGPGAFVYLSAHLAGGPLALWLGSILRH